MSTRVSVLRSTLIGSRIKQNLSNNPCSLRTSLFDHTSFIKVVIPNTLVSNRLKKLLTKLQWELSCLDGWIHCDCSRPKLCMEIPRLLWSWEERLSWKNPLLELWKCCRLCSRWGTCFCPKGSDDTWILVLVLSLRMQCQCLLQQRDDYELTNHMPLQTFLGNGDLSWQYLRNILIYPAISLKSQFWPTVLILRLSCHFLLPKHTSHGLSFRSRHSSRPPFEYQWQRRASCKSESWEFHRWPNYSGQSDVGHPCEFPSEWQVRCSPRLP